MKFNELNISGIILSLLGLVFFPISIFHIIIAKTGFLTQTWIGLIPLILGIIFILIDSVNQQTASKSRISSHLLLFYKYVVAFIYILVLGFLISACFFMKNDIEVLILLSVVFGFGFVFFGWILINLKFVQYDDESIFVSNYFKIEEYDLMEIEGIERIWISFYVISVKDRKKKIFTVPIMNEVYNSLLVGTPKSIKRLEKYKRLRTTRAQT
jgi:hypothetical protein